MASAATIQVAFRSKEAQRSIEKLDKRLEKLDSSVTGLAKTFENITTVSYTHLTLPTKRIV